MAITFGHLSLLPHALKVLTNTLSGSVKHLDPGCRVLNKNVFSSKMSKGEKQRNLQKSKLKKQLRGHRRKNTELTTRQRTGAQETRHTKSTGDHDKHYDNEPTRTKGSTETYIHTGKAGAIEHRWNK